MSDLETNTENIDVDPILFQREEIRRKVKLFKRIGYSLMLLSILSVFACIPLQWPYALVIVAMVSFVLSCAILPLPIIFWVWN